MIGRVLVLLFAIVLIAAGTERMCADVCSDSMADILDEDTVIQVVRVAPLSSPPSMVQTAAPTTGGAPGPAAMRVFRPPRSMRA